MIYSFEIPVKLPGMSDIAYTALQIAALSSRLALEDRTLVNHKTGRAENVAEHSHMVAMVASAIAEEYYPDLDAGLVSRFANIHDTVEAYVGDTATHNITEKELVNKAEREAKGLAQMKKDFQHLPKFVSLIEQYESQKIPEARFVRVIDKWAPTLVHFADNGATLRAYSDPHQLAQNAKARSVKLKKQYPDFVELIEVRLELSALAGEHLIS